MQKKKEEEDDNVKSGRVKKDELGWNTLMKLSIELSIFRHSTVII